MRFRSGGKINEGRVYRPETRGAYILRYTHYLLIDVRLGHPHTLSDRVFARPESTRCGLADDNDVLVPSVLAWVEPAAADDRNTEKLEVVRRNFRVGDLKVAALTFERDHSAAARAAQGHGIYKSHAADTRASGEPFRQLAVKGLSPGFVVAFQAEIEAGRHDAPSLKPGIDRLGGLQ